MSVEHVVFYAIIYTSLYALFLLMLSKEYESFLKSKGFERRSALRIATYAFCVIMVSVIGITLYVNAVGIPSALIVVFYLAVLLPVLVRARGVIKLRERAAPRTLGLDGENVECYAYSGSNVNALYSTWDKRVYVHESLEGLLSENELKAVIYHEHRHREQVSGQFYYKALFVLVIVAIALWVFAGLVISALASYIVSGIILFPGAVLGEMLAVVPALVAIYFTLALFSLIVVYLRWVWEHDADLYAAGRVGAEVLARALVKTHLAISLAEDGRYVSLQGISADIKLEDVPPLGWRGVFRELLCRTLSLRGLMDVWSFVAKPLEETHPPLHLRLRAIRTAVG